MLIKHKLCRESNMIVLNAAQEIQRETVSHVLVVPTDVTREEDIEAIVAATVQGFGYIDNLANNVGGPFLVCSN